ncbi:MAG TPA: magnesium/cobalt transporter CorA [Polyangia bacterium]|nr:magnesium/cobalt transporter CorA [Polyangia bacterium]
MKTRKERKSVRATRGLAPGTLIHIGERKAERVRLTLVEYDEGRFAEREIATVEEAFPFAQAPTVTWLNVDGLHDIGTLERIGERFGVHHLVLEDILNTGQRPKVEFFESHVFLTSKVVARGPGGAGLDAEQVSLLLGERFVISFQEKATDLFAPILARIREGKGRIRRLGSDYLAYALLDAVTDNCFFVLEEMGEQVEALEERLIQSADRDSLGSIHALKRELVSLRRAIWPLRELISALQREESPFVSDAIDAYLRDLYDHTIQVIDSVESYRETLAGLTDLYLSSVNARTNEVMKVLTIIATIFIPLTFVAGIYGMNFDTSASAFNMPELGWPFGYLGVLGVMGAIAAGMLVYFKRKRWL